MTSSEAVSQLKELGLGAFANRSALVVIYKQEVVAIAKVNELYNIQTNLKEMREVPINLQESIFKILIEYALTPLEDR